jgi:hypothetical protein
VRLERDYDLFLPIFNHPYELFALATIPDWRARCRVAACFVSEIWVHLLPGYLLELLAEFDHVFAGVHHSVGEVARSAGRPCAYRSPPTCSASLRPPAPAPRHRRLQHRAALGDHAPGAHGARQKRRIFYYYDTVAASGVDRKQRTFSVDDASEHRLLSPASCSEAAATSPTGRA